MFKGFKRIYNLFRGNVFVSVIIDPERRAIFYAEGYLPTDAVQAVQQQKRAIIEASRQLEYMFPVEQPEVVVNVATEQVIPAAEDVLRELEWLQGPVETEIADA